MSVPTTVAPAGDSLPIKVIKSLIKFSDTPQTALATSKDGLNLNLTYCEKNPALALISYKISETDIKKACFQSLSSPTFQQSQIIISSPVLKITYTKEAAKNQDLVSGLDDTATETTTTTAPLITPVNSINLVNKGGYWTTYDNKKNISFKGTTDGSTQLTVLDISSNEVITTGMIITDAGTAANINVETQVESMDNETFGGVGNYELDRTQPLTLSTQNYIGIGSQVPLFSDDYLLGTYTVTEITLSFKFTAPSTSLTSKDNFLTVANISSLRPFIFSSELVLLQDTGTYPLTYVKDGTVYANYNLWLKLYCNQSNNKAFLSYKLNAADLKSALVEHLAKAGLKSLKRVVVDSVDIILSVFNTVTTSDITIQLNYTKSTWATNPEIDDYFYTGLSPSSQIVSFLTNPAGEYLITGIKLIVAIVVVA